MDGENFFLNLSSGANNMEKALKKFNESVQKFAKRYNTTIEPHQFSLFTNQDFIGNITPISEKKNLTIVGQVSIEGDGT
ncbi:hypothetical protein IJM86_00190 [bacterium]|nr:hypothetical protein [bacterium]